jgi:pimeloyl-ACP methyl ester carboxylesterase
MQNTAVSFREVGTGTGVVCLHSSASTSGQWRSLMDVLARRFRVMAADLYGYGQSPAWADDRKLTLADEASLVEPVFRAAGERFHLIGHSYGGAVALRAALDAPERIRSLVLVEPVLFALLLQEDPEQAAAREIASVRDDTIAAVECGELERSAERFVDYWMGPGSWSKLPDKRRAPIASAMRKVKSDWNALFTEPTPLAAFSKLAVNTLYIIGSESPASSRATARLLIPTLPSVTVVEMAGIGHMGILTHPEKFNAEIERFLDRVL